MEALFSTFLEDKQLIDGIGSYQLRDYPPQIQYLLLSYASHGRSPRRLLL